MHVKRDSGLLKQPLLLIQQNNLLVQHVMQIALARPLIHAAQKVDWLVMQIICANLDTLEMELQKLAKHALQIALFVKLGED